ncbi:T9SS type A sorting domain-containing protein [Geofilum rubicundum]|uniref:OmpA-like transmembrane domain protein n=1 Tax=Geofilum rubicundum JCM 15548 TaxID=1236989 RepID=A0A0E9LUZ7_9BACT|nr:T9SS type A sorting domain-containing protein [Geofilum rubicundum]GAO29128.1 OmpA-like transmembrane domain protein [Geofilum rubicundum JCM 15548]
MKNNYKLKIFISIFLFSSPTLTLLGQEDSNAPVLNSISISNEEINAGDEITFIINVTDDISGLDYAYISIKNPYGGQTQSFIGGSFSRDWTYLGNDNYSTTTKITEYAIKGIWYVDRISIYDNADNYMSISSYSESILTFNVMNDITIEDSNPPNLNSISIINEEINAGDEITFVINVTDDISGLDYAYISINNPYGGQNQSFIGGSFSRDWTYLGDDNYSISIKINEFAVSGSWYVDRISIYDNADNYMSKSSYSESILSFIVIGDNEDIQPPTLNSISINNEEINAGDEITFVINVTDDISGLDYAYISIKNPYGEQTQSFIGGSFLRDWTYLGGDSYSTSTKLNEFAVSGSWYVDRISIYDNADNYLSISSYSESILTFEVGSITTKIENVSLLNEITFMRRGTNIYKIKSPVEIISYDLYNLNGKKISVGKSDPYTINLSSVENGLYIVNILTETGRISKKIIK